MKNKDFLSTTMALFLIIGVAHLYRAFNNVPVTIGHTIIPVWFSWFAAALALWLCYSAYKLRS